MGASFRRLRQQLIWKKNVIRAKGIFEVTWNEERGQWHPHLHILAEGRYIDTHQLSHAWEAASNGSTIVHLRPVDDAASGIRYVCKYLGKAPDLSKATDPIDRLAEYYSATRSRKLILHCGRWPDIDEPEETAEDPDDPQDWVIVGRVNAVYMKAKGGNPDAVKLIKNLWDAAEGLRVTSLDGLQTRAEFQLYDD